MAEDQITVNDLVRNVLVKFGKYHIPAFDDNSSSDWL